MSESHIRIENKFFRNPEYIKFDKSVKSTVYRFLQAAIVRESKEVKNYTFGAKYIYTKHFLNGRLVSRYSQNAMAEYLHTSQGSINKYLQELNMGNIIKIIREKAPFGELCFYQLGTWNGTPGKKDYQEFIWLDEIFSELILKYKSMKENKEEEKRDKSKFEGIYSEIDRIL
jgi:hypothetical protein